MMPLRQTRVACTLMVLAIALGGCARYQHYQPAPLAPTGEAAAYRARRLDDPALAGIVAAQGLAVRDSAWDSRRLAIAALYFRPDLTEARQSLAFARAGEITAGARPYPTASVGVDRAERATEGRSTPWTFSLATGFTIERGGKRAARIARAHAVTLAARLQIESTSWQVIDGVRAASAAAVAADVNRRDARAELEQLRTVLALVRKRFTEGQITRTEVARAEGDVQSSSVSATEAMRAVSDARSALAHAVGVPVTQVEQLTLRPDARSACGALDSLSADTLRVLALQTLPGIGVALANYEVAESDVRGEIAAQYPDIVLGPGLTWEQGVRRWILSLGIPGIPTDGVRGPIAEAVARRAVQAARVKLVQDSALAAVDSSATACRSARREVAVADSLVGTSRAQFALIHAAYDRGEIGRTEIALAQLALVRAERSQHQAVQNDMIAGVALQNATGVWLSGTPIDRQRLAMPTDDIKPDPRHVRGPQ